LAIKVCGSIESNEKESLNSELCKQALAKVGNPNVLVNLISRRVRQLNSGGGANSRPLIADTANLGVADIALMEIIEDKMGWDMPVENVLVEEKPKRRKRG
jgi:DNA-directed RNA polymerase subunit omega